MGNAASNAARALRPGSAVARQAKRRLPEAPPVDEGALLRKIQQDDALRQKEQASDEELGRKETHLDDLLSKLQGSIRPKPVKVTGREEEDTQPSAPPQKATVMSAADFSQPIPLYRPSGQRQQQQGSLADSSHGSPWQASQDEERGRAQAYALRELLEAKNYMEKLKSDAVRLERWSNERGSGASTSAPNGSSGSWLSVGGKGQEGAQEMDLAALASSHGLDFAKVEQLLKYTCIPNVGRFQTFGHEYAFARPPRWWLYGSVSQQYRPTFKSEPEPPKPPASSK